MQAKDILQRASITLHDSGSVRWPLPELLLYLNDAMEELALHKPNAVTQTVELTLGKGTWQTVVDPHISLVRVIRNLATLDASASKRTGGIAITVTERMALDLVMPGWQDPSVLAQSAVVNHIIQDLADPRSFYVVPGNDGTGTIEAVVAVKPAAIVEPGNPLDIASYAIDITDVPMIFKNALTDYVLYRAYSKDSTDPGAAQRSQAHYQLFANAIGLKQQTDAITNVNTTGQT